jgi:single-strand DNA-binding protein
MHGNIETAFIGRLGQDPELKTSAAGKPRARLSVAVGAGDEAQWVSVAVFGEAAERLCAALEKGNKVYVEGTLRLSEWTGRNGEKRTGLSVAAWKAEKLGAIGRNKPAKAKSRDAAQEIGAGDGKSGHKRDCQPVDALIPF